jgi:hypothetical protein
MLTASRATLGLLFVLGLGAGEPGDEVPPEEPPPGTVRPAD